MRVSNKWALAVAMTVMMLCVAGFAQQTAQPQSMAVTAANTTESADNTTSSAPKLQQRDERYEIHAGDSFDVAFELSPEFNQTGVVVQPDGFITMRSIGDIKVDGENVPQLTQTLRTAYSKILHDPIITVTLKDFEKPYFIADGQIGRPGKYDLRGNVTLTQAIAIAGGFQDSAKHSQVLLFRRVSDQWLEAKIFNVKKMEKSGKLSEDPYLHPGDMLFVPKSKFSKIARFISAPSIGTMLKPY